MVTKEINPKSIDEMPSINYEEKIAELNTEKNILGSIIIEKEKEILEITNDLVEKDIELAKKDKALFDSNNVIAEKDKALDEKDDEIKKLKQRIELLENGSS